MNKQPHMLNALVEIAGLNNKALRSWFSKGTVSKLVVMFAYLTVLIAVFLGIFFWSNAFFKYLIGFEQYGKYTSEYILKGAFVILIWVGILSSMVSTASFLLTQNRYTDLLLTFPISDFVLSFHQTLRSLLTNTFLFLVSILPLLLGFILSQKIDLNAGLYVGPLVSLVTLVFLTESIGSSFAYLFTFLVKKRFGFYVLVLSILALISSTWLVIRIVFPPELRLLENVSAENFAILFNSLPLNSRCWLGNSFVNLSVNTSLQSLSVSLLAAILFSVSLFIQKKLFITCRQSSRINPKTSEKVIPYFSLGHPGLAIKDVYSIVRNPQNLGYAIFLMIMTITFFGLFSRGYTVGTIPERFRVDAISFSFSWLVFFSGTFLLRFTFPLMVNEGRSRWWFFTLPISGGKAVQKKILASLLISIPLYLVTCVQWYLVPFAINPSFIVVLSLFSVTFLAISLPLIGSLNPDYSLAYDPDKASTSFAGIISLIFIIATGALGSYLIQMSLKRNLGVDISLNTFFTFALIITLLLWFLSAKATSKYKLDS